LNRHAVFLDSQRGRRIRGNPSVRESEPRPSPAAAAFPSDLVDGVLGLNTFLLSFISAYPALIWPVFGRSSGL
jgi:hypothetical protein